NRRKQNGATHPATAAPSTSDERRRAYPPMRSSSSSRSARWKGPAIASVLPVTGCCTAGATSSSRSPNTTATRLRGSCSCAARAVSCRNSAVSSAVSLSWSCHCPFTCTVRALSTVSTTKAAGFSTRQLPPSLSSTASLSAGSHAPCCTSRTSWNDSGSASGPPPHWSPVLGALPMSGIGNCGLSGTSASSSEQAVNASNAVTNTSNPRMTRPWHHPILVGYSLSDIDREPTNKPGTEQTEPFDPCSLVRITQHQQHAVTPLMSPTEVL